MAAEGLGGAQRLIAWAKESPGNEHSFWTSIYPKLLPLQVQGDKEHPLHVITKVELVPLRGDGKD